MSTRSDIIVHLTDGRYATREEADAEAKIWAENEGIRHRPPEADKKALENHQK